MKKLILASLVILTSCGKPQKDIDVETIHVNPSTSATANLYDICDSIKIIKLANSQEFTGTNLDERVIVAEDYIFIKHNQGRNQYINIYSLDGVLLNKLSKIGRGRGEYIDIESFCYDKNQNTLVICNSCNKQLLHYSLPDLDFIQKTDLEFIPYYITDLNSDKIYVGHKDKNLVAGILKNDSLSKPTIPYNKFTLSIAREITIFSLQRNSLIYSFNSVNPVIYKITDTLCQPQYKIDFGNNALSDKELYDNNDPLASYNFKMKFDEKKCTGVVHNTIISDNMVTFSYVYQKLDPRNSQIGVYDIHNKTCTNYKGFKVSGITNPLLPQTTYDNFFVNLVIPDNISLSGEETNDILGQTISHEINSKTENRDSYLVLYRLRNR
ncbi:MAG: 6-bladed beta-propeller [Marinifilaceae bacterium]